MNISPSSHPSSMAGFSLLELLLVIAVLAIIGSIGTGYYFNLVKDLELVSAKDILIEDLKRVQNSSMIGEGGLFWGVHFVNGSDDLYQIFSTQSDFASTSTTVIATTYLPNLVTFTDPAESATKDIIFRRITGTTTSTSITITSPDSSEVITVPALGHAF